MRTATVTIRGISPYSPSGYISPISSPKGQNEQADAYEKRTWRDRIHRGPDGKIIIEPMAFKNALSSAASFRGERVSGKGQKTYTKIFEAGVMVTEPLVLGVDWQTVPGDWLFVPSDGKRGGGKRVMKCFARIDQWGGDVTFTILHDAISEEVFARHVECAGTFIGIGRFRPERNGYFGRFAVEKVKWAEI